MSSARRRVSLEDVARRAGVSPATASRALGGHPHVAGTTRTRVRAAADALDYVASPEASRLARGATGRVAVVVPHLGRWFFGELLEGLEPVLRAAALDVLLFAVGDAADRREFFEKLPARRKVDAVVVLAFPVDPAQCRRLDLLGVDVVAAGGPFAGYPSVGIDDRAAGRRAVDHLLHLGHRRIAMIATADPDQPEAAPRGRSVGYADALRDAGCAPDPELTVTVDWGGEGGAEAMAALLGLRVPPTAVFAHSDEVALGAVRTLRRTGLRVPEDVSVVGVDDHPLAALADLTTVAQPVREQGRAAGRMVVAALRGGGSPQSVTVPTRLVLRRSTAPPRGPVAGVPGVDRSVGTTRSARS